MTLTGVAAGNLICIWVKHEGTPVGISVSDGTTTLTAGTKTDHGNGDLSGQFHYLLSANSGNKTYTVTFSGSVSRSFISLIAFEYSYSGTASLDGENGGSGNGTTLTSGNFTTTATDGVAFGGYGEYSTATLTTSTINGAAADGTIQLSGNTFSAAWRKTFSAGFTGAAAGTLDNSFDWLCRGVAFKAVAGGGGTVNDEVLEDTITVSDGSIASAIRARILADAIAVTEGPTIFSTAFGVVATDDITITDGSVLFYRRNRLLESFVGITDEALAQLLTGNVLVRVLSDALGVSDELLAYCSRNRLLESFLLLTDETLPAMQRFIMLTDLVTVSDDLVAAVITQTIVTPRIVVGFDQPNIKVGGRAIVTGGI